MNLNDVYLMGDILITRVSIEPIEGTDLVSFFYKEIKVTELSALLYKNYKIDTLKNNSISKVVYSEYPDNPYDYPSSLKVTSEPSKMYTISDIKEIVIHTSKIHLVKTHRIDKYSTSAEANENYEILWNKVKDRIKELNETEEKIYESAIKYYDDRHGVKYFVIESETTLFDKKKGIFTKLWEMW